ncbi:MAG TPA: hypothetical protein VKB86_15150 [Pyrinomonadaceae bacterium]|nr:hypothetical protein [Pyrinomonadaceae bacterium]
MACSFTRQDVSDIVIEVIEQTLGVQFVTEQSNFEEDLGVDSDAQALLFFPIKMSVEKVGCLLKQFNAQTCQNAKTVGDIVDAICKDFGI